MGQDSQFTSPHFTQSLLDAGVKVSMDDRGRWMDNHRASNDYGGCRSANASICTPPRQGLQQGQALVGTEFSRLADEPLSRPAKVPI